MDGQSVYRTRQKTLIEECLRNTGGRHITAETVAALLTAQGTPVGMATIYRQLERLVEEGTVRKYVLDGKTGACYQYNGETVCEHFHLKCLKCGELFHADCDFLNRLSEHIYREHGFSVDNTKTVFYGECAACRRKEKKGGGAASSLNKGEKLI